VSSKDIEAEVIRITDEGIHFRETGDFEAAAARFDEALQLDPSHAQSWYNLGVTLHDLGNREAALECYRQAVNHDPGLVNAWSNIGWTLLEMGEIEEADLLFEGAIDVDPDYPKSYVGKASICVLREDPDNARRYCAMALERDPMSLRAHQLLRSLVE
jgi:tetratricopeptide (TPR) repeat protein